MTAQYPNIPFQARSCGHHQITDNYIETPLRKDFVELYWCLEGKGQFIINNQVHYLHPGEVCFYVFGNTHRVSCAGELFRYRWMTFDGPAAMTVWKGLHLPQEPRIAGRCPEELFLQLEDEILNYSQDGLRMASATTFRILMLAANHTPTVLPTYDFVEQARKVIEAQFQNPHLNIGVIAKRLDVDRSQLSRKFHDVCGVSPVQYLINLRIQHGMDLLANSSLMVKEIATRSGFSDPNYFTKAILKYTGGTVRDYRQSNQVNYTNVQD